MTAIPSVARTAAGRSDRRASARPITAATTRYRPRRLASEAPSVMPRPPAPIATSVPTAGLAGAGVDVREADCERHSGDGREVVLAEERSLPAAGSADKSDRAPEDRYSGVDHDQLGERGEALARLKKGGGSEGQRGELGELPGRGERVGAVRDRGRDDQKREQGRRPEQPG